MGSAEPAVLGADPQQDLPPARTRNAASPYFLPHLFLDFHDACSYLHTMIFAGLIALLRVQHSA